jgi:uncharacterized protein (DUF1778 family)
MVKSDSKKKVKDKLIKFRISEDEKTLFENNAQLQGYTSLSEFIRFTLNNSCWGV